MQSNNTNKTPSPADGRVRRKSGRPLNYSRALLDDAVSDILSRKSRGEPISVREAAERFRVPKSTLHRHLKLATEAAESATASSPVVPPPAKSCIPFLVHADSDPSFPPRPSSCPCTDRVRSLQHELREVRATVARLEHAIANAAAPTSPPPSAHTRTGASATSPVSAAAHSGDRSTTGAAAPSAAAPPSTPSVSVTQGVDDGGGHPLHHLVKDRMQKLTH